MPRPYGYSPSPIRRARDPEIVAPTPVIIRTVRSSEASPGQDPRQVAQAPRRINPYAAAGAEKTMVAAKTSHGPQVIYSMAAANDVQ